MDKGTTNEVRALDAKAELLEHKIERAKEVLKGLKSDYSQLRSELRAAIREMREPTLFDQHPETDIQEAELEGTVEDAPEDDFVDTPLSVLP